MSENDEFVNRLAMTEEEYTQHQAVLAEEAKFQENVIGVGAILLFLVCVVGSAWERRRKARRAL